MDFLVIDHGCNSHAPDAFGHQTQKTALIGVNIGCAKMPVKSAPEATIAPTFVPSGAEEFNSTAFGIAQRIDDAALSVVASCASI